MRAIAKAIGIVLAVPVSVFLFFFVREMLFSTPEQQLANQQRIQKLEACEEMMADAAPGAERRAIRSVCMAHGVEIK